MSRLHSLSPLALAAILILGMAGTACDEPASDRTISTAPRRTPEPLIDDPRIGEGLPAEVRFAGTEHNRLTVMLLRQARDPVQRRLALNSPCETVVAGLVTESPRTAARASIPDRADQLATIVRGVMAAQPMCRGRIAQPSMEGILGDANVTGDAHPDSMLTEASFSVIDQLIQRLQAVTSAADVQAALDAATDAATTLGAADALAVYAAVAQSQGSFVLWGPGGGGWSELGLPSPMQSVFREGELGAGFFGAMGAVLAADAGGCRGAISFLRMLPIVQDSRLLIGACAIAAAATTVGATYALYNQY